MPTNTVKVDVCIIGAGAGGLSVAAGAIRMGATVALIEEGKMGGQSLNTGCIPSKSLITAARMAQAFRTAETFGITTPDPEIDFTKVMGYVKGVIKTLAANDSIDRYSEMGVIVIQGHAKFLNPKTVMVGEMMIQARRYVIASGSVPAVPLLPGLEQVPFLTNETLFNLTKKPEHLIVIGGGSVGCELAQAFLLLGSKVTLLEVAHILSRDDVDMVNVVRDELVKQGMTIHERVKIVNISKQDNQITVTREVMGKQVSITGSELLLTVGRRANVQKLNLEAAGVRFTTKGVEVSATMQTSNKIVYALGDAVGGYLFTHMAQYQANIVVRNILLRWPVKANYSAVPWVTYTTPELAHVGLSSAVALKQDPACKTLKYEFKNNDRANTENNTVGMIKVMTTAKGKILGATIVGPQASELILPWVIAIQENKSIKQMAEIIAPYPTLSEISKRVADEYFLPQLSSTRTRSIVKFLRLFG